MRLKLLIIFFLSFTCLQCARIRYYNAPADQSRLKMEIAELQFKTGEHIKLKNIIVNLDNGTIASSSDEEVFRYNLRDLESFRYSNSDLGSLGFIVGFSAAFMVYEANRSKSRSGEWYTIDPGSFISFSLGCLSGIIGYQFGSKSPIQWQEFDLTPYRKPPG